MRISDILKGCTIITGFLVDRRRNDEDGTKLKICEEEEVKKHLKANIKDDKYCLELEMASAVHNNVVLLLTVETSSLSQYDYCYRVIRESIS